MAREIQRLILCLVLFLISSSFAATTNAAANTTASIATSKQSEEKATDKKRGWEQSAIDGNIRISGWLDSAAEWLDVMLAGDRMTRKRNETNLRIENSSIWKEGIGYTNSTAFNVNLRLPNVEEYWNLKFTSYDEEDDKRSSENAQYRDRQRTKNYGATIGLFRKLGNVKTSFQPRIELQDPLKVSHTISVETNMTIGKSFGIFPKLELFAAPDRGTGVFDQLSFGFPLNHIYYLMISNQSTYRDKGQEFLVAQGFSVSRNVIKDATIAYSVFFNSENQPAYHLQSYSFAATWSHLLYKNILDYSVVPHIDFDKRNHFTGRLGFDFTVALQF